MRQFLVSVAILSAVLTGCSKPSVLKVEGAVVKLPAVPGNPGAAYFTLQGGAKADRLMSVTSPQVVRAEMHDNVMAGGMMKMTPLDAGVDLPAGATVTFASGGKHVMLFDINPKSRPGTTMKLSFTFASGTKIESDAKVEAAGGTVETMDKMEHDH